MPSCFCLLDLSNPIEPHTRTHTHTHWYQPREAVTQSKLCSGCSSSSLSSGICGSGTVCHTLRLRLCLSHCLHLLKVIYKYVQILILALSLMHNSPATPLQHSCLSQMDVPLLMSLFSFLPLTFSLTHSTPPLTKLHTPLLSAFTR